jgi:hypothetical protein
MTAILAISMLESVALLSTLFEKIDILDYLALNAPDDLVLGLSAQLITCFFGNSRVENFVGADFTVYEDNDGITVFYLIQVSVSLDGLALTDVTPSKTSYIAIVGDALHGAPTFARSYDLGAMVVARYIRIEPSQVYRRLICFG